MLPILVTETGKTSVRFTAEYGEDGDYGSSLFVTDHRTGDIHSESLNGWLLIDDCDQSPYYIKGTKKYYRHQTH